MGPAFSLFLATTAAGALVVCVFCILRFKYSAWSALVLAVTFAGGAALAFVLAVFSAAMVIGVGPTLESDFAVGLYLTWLASASIAGGIAAVRCAPRLAVRLWTKAPTTPPQSH
jgi:hypothetical protein